MDYILFVKADVTLDPNPEEVMVSQAWAHPRAARHTVLTSQKKRTCGWVGPAAAAASGLPPAVSLAAISLSALA